eukprot:768060-Hanusia_phi.AAC.3
MTHAKNMVGECLALPPCDPCRKILIAEKMKAMLGSSSADSLSPLLLSSFSPLYPTFLAAPPLLSPILRRLRSSAPPPPPCLILTRSPRRQCITER